MKKRQSTPMYLFLAVVALIVGVGRVEGADRSSSWTPNDDGRDRTEQARLELWSRGLFDLEDYSHYGSGVHMGPVSYVRSQTLFHRNSPNCDMNGYCRIRGGAQNAADYEKHSEQKIHELGLRFGSEFLEAIQKNKEEHAEDCKRSCEIYYCADSSKPLVSLDELLGETTIKSYSMGSVPPEDFAESFG